MMGLLCAASSLSTRSSTASAVVEAGSKPYSKDVIQNYLIIKLGGTKMRN